MPTVGRKAVVCEAAECNHVRTIERSAFVAIVLISKGLEEGIYVSIKGLIEKVDHCTPAILTLSVIVSNITNPMLLIMLRR